MSVQSVLGSIMCADMSITVHFLDRIQHHPLLSEAASSNALGSPHLWQCNVYFDMSM